MPLAARDRRTRTCRPARQTCRGRLLSRGCRCPHGGRPSRLDPTPGAAARGWPTRGRGCPAKRSSNTRPSRHPAGMRLCDTRGPAFASGWAPPRGGIARCTGEVVARPLAIRKSRTAARRRPAVSTSWFHDPAWRFVAPPTSRPPVARRDGPSGGWIESQMLHRVRQMFGRPLVRVGNRVRDSCPSGTHG